MDGIKGVSHPVLQATGGVYRRREPYMPMVTSSWTLLHPYRDSPGSNGLSLAMDLASMLRQGNKGHEGEEEENQQ